MPPAMHKPTETDAYQLLTRLNIPYQIIEHAPLFSVRDCSVALPGPQVKNLLLKTRKGQVFLLLVHDEIFPDLKQLAEQLGVGRLSFCSATELDELLGLPPGAVTPLALAYDQAGRVQVLLDQAIDPHNTIGCHPNVNTATVILSVQDLLAVLTELAHPPRWIRAS